MCYPSIKKATYEDKFARRYACWWKRGKRKYKTANRKAYRRYLTKTDRKEARDESNFS